MSDTTSGNSDGTEILNDITPPQPADGVGTICLGVFKKTGPRAYRLKHPFWSIEANGNLAATGVLSESVIVDVGRDSYQGSFTQDLYDLSGNLIDEVKGTLTAAALPLI